MGLTTPRRNATYFCVGLTTPRRDATCLQCGNVGGPLKHQKETYICGVKVARYPPRTLLPMQRIPSGR